MEVRSVSRSSETLDMSSKAAIAREPPGVKPSAAKAGAPTARGSPAEKPAPLTVGCVLALALAALVAAWWPDPERSLDDVIARTQYENASLKLGMGRWQDLFRTLLHLHNVAYGFIATSETALMRTVLREWQLDARRRLVKQEKGRAAVLHAWCSLLRWSMALWLKMVFDAKSARNALVKGVRMWVYASLTKGWNGWAQYANERAHYRRIAAQIASPLGMASVAQRRVSMTLLRVARETP